MLQRLGSRNLCGSLRLGIPGLGFRHTIQLAVTTVVLSLNMGSGMPNVDYFGSSTAQRQDGYC